MAALPATTSLPTAFSTSTQEAVPVVTTSSAAVVETTSVVASTAEVVTPSTSVVVVTSSTQIQSVVPTSTSISTIPLTSTTPTSTILPSTSTTPTTTSTSLISITPSTSTSTSTSTTPTSTTPLQTSTAIVTVTSVRGSQSAPGLVTGTKSTSSARGSASAAAGGAGSGKSGVGGSGLSLGALIGIIAGGLVFLIVLALLVTRSLRKKARQRRTANRSSLFEPWPAPVAMEEEDGYEKGSYPMQEQPEYESNYPNYAGAGAGATATAAAGYTQHNQQPHQYVEYPTAGQPQQQSQGYYPPTQGQGPQGYADEGVVGAVGASGLRDGSMVRVKVGFVRSLEDELAIVPGQQLYLHTAYDDGWSLCEDQNQTRGVVPVSCLEPWDEPTSMTRSNTNGSLNVNAAGQRRSSLYNNAAAGADYLNMPQHG